MTAINITDNDLTNPTATMNSRVHAYNDNYEDMMDFVMTGGMDPVELQSTSVSEDLGCTLVLFQDVVVEPDEDQEAANDNEPTQLELF
jgi:hypothetical protein